MTRQRFGYLVPEFPGQTHVFFWHEVEALRSAGEDVLLISTRKPPPHACRHEFAPAAAAETHYLFPPAASRLVRWSARGGQGLRRAIAYLRGLEASGLRNRVRQSALLAVAVDLVEWAYKEQITHIHAHSCADAAHVVALSRSLGGPPYSLALHGDLDVYGIDHRSKMREATFISTDGAHLREQILARAGVSEDRVFTTFMGVKTADLAQLGKDRSQIPGKLHLLTVARLHPAKGHVHALAAVHRAVLAGLDIRYTIAGDGPYRADLESRIHKLGLGNRVTLTGTASEGEVNQLLSDADAFVLPSTGMGEAWPVIVMQAMAAGLPVITSIIGATGEMITTGEDGLLVPQGDEDGLFNAIAQLTEDVETRRRIGQAARRAACQRFDVAVTAGRLRNAIRASRAGLTTAAGQTDMGFTQTNMQAGGKHS